MIILIDVGNTALTYGVYEGGRFLSYGSKVHSNIPKLVKYCTKSGNNKSFNVVISSVVPKITSIIKKSFKRAKGCKVWVAGENLPIPINHKYKEFNKLGRDRAVNLYGALRIHRPPMLVIDYGTAVTFDYLSPQGVFEGGMIIPGPEISFQALLQRAALIPKTIRLPKKSPSFLGRSTYDCIKAGILEGYGAMTDGLIELFRKRFGKNLRVLATGGFAQHLAPYCHSINIKDSKHSLKSLLILFKDYRSR
ncbi:MAG: type III pantothenate kinase [Candidatus Omnitrophica bacterium]|nr:type III pantothenate kinase [Candidatus Omnitrophota bacterium]